MAAAAVRSRSRKRCLAIGVVVATLAAAAPAALVLSPAGAVTGDIETFAGEGTGCPTSACFTGEGGPAPDAQLWSPTGVAAAADGRVFIADNRNNGVRVVEGGIITTVYDGGLGDYDVAVDDANQKLYISESAAGSWERIVVVDLTTNMPSVFAGGASGFAGDNGPASAAQFKNISGIDVGPDGDVWIADKGNQRIRRIDVGVDPPTITTVAGTGAAGGDDGPATTVAQLADPLDVAVADDGTAYIADQLTNRVRILSGGNVGSFAGNFTPGFSGDDGPATGAQLNKPSGLTVGPDGTVYIADSQNNRVRAVKDGIITTVVGDGSVGGGDGGPATDAGLAFPIGLAIDHFQSLYIASQLENKVRVVEGPGPFCIDPVPGKADGIIQALPIGAPLGAGVYNLDGSDQTVFVGLEPGEKASTSVTYRNASTKIRTIGVRVVDLEGDADDFVVKVFKGDKDITHLVVDGGKFFKERQPGSFTPALRVQVRMRSSAPPDAFLEVVVRGTYGKKTPVECGDTVVTETAIPV